MKELVEQQYRNVERSFILNTGPYEVSPEYISYRVDAHKWIKRTSGYKEKVIATIHKLPLNPIVQSGPDCSINDTLDIMSPLSVSYKDADMSKEIYEGMWLKASELIAKGNAITDAPGLESAKKVYSFTNPNKPHLVQHYKNGK
jgi:hypothetical protein